jgi:hypothetical protein
MQAAKHEPSAQARIGADSEGDKRKYAFGIFLGGSPRSPRLCVEKVSRLNHDGIKIPRGKKNPAQPRGSFGTPGF